MAESKEANIKEISKFCVHKKEASLEESLRKKSQKDFHFTCIFPHFFLDFCHRRKYTKSMDLKTVLTPETVELHLKGKTKEEIIDEMLEILIKAGKVTDKAAARECVLDRERKMSTGMKHGIAIPHGKTDTVSDLVACIGISDNPVDFDSLDQEPCRIFIMTLSPVNKTGPHLQFLAEVSLLFKSAEKRAQILATQDKAEVIKILTD